MEKLLFEIRFKQKYLVSKRAIKCQKRQTFSENYTIRKKINNIYQHMVLS